MHFKGLRFCTILELHKNLSTLQSISYLFVFALGFLKANCNIHDCKRTLYKIHLTYWRNLVRESRIIIITSILKEYWILMYLQKLKFSLLPLVIEIQKKLLSSNKLPPAFYNLFFLFFNECLEANALCKSIRACGYI